MGINSEKIMLDYIYLPRNFVSRRRNGGIVCRSFKMLDATLALFYRSRAMHILPFIHPMLPVFPDKHLYLFFGGEGMNILYNIPNVLRVISKRKEKKERKKEEAKRGREEKRIAGTSKLFFLGKILTQYFAIYSF